MATAHEVGLKTTSTIMFGHLDQPHHWYTFTILSGERCTHVSSPFIFKENHLITSRSLWIQGQAFAAIEKFGKGDWWFHRVCSSSLCAHGGLNLSKWFLHLFTSHSWIWTWGVIQSIAKFLCGIPTRIMSLQLLLMKYLRSHYELGNRCKEPCHGCLLQPMVGAMSPLSNVVVRLWQGHQL